MSAASFCSLRTVPAWPVADQRPGLVVEVVRGAVARAVGVGVAAAVQPGVLGGQVEGLKVAAVGVERERRRGGGAVGVVRDRVAQHDRVGRLGEGELDVLAGGGELDGLPSGGLGLDARVGGAVGQHGPVGLRGRGPVLGVRDGRALGRQRHAAGDRDVVDRDVAGVAVGRVVLVADQVQSGTQGEVLGRGQPTAAGRKAQLAVADAVEEQGDGLRAAGGVVVAERHRVGAGRRHVDGELHLGAGGGEAGQVTAPGVAADRGGDAGATGDEGRRGLVGLARRRRVGRARRGRRARAGAGGRRGSGCGRGRRRRAGGGDDGDAVEVDVAAVGRAEQVRDGVAAGRQRQAVGDGAPDVPVPGRRQLVLLDERPVHIDRQRHRRRGAVRIAQHHRRRVGRGCRDGEGGLGRALVAVGVALDETGTGVTGVIGADHRAAGQRRLICLVDGGRGDRADGDGVEVDVATVERVEHVGDGVAACRQRQVVGDGAPGVPVRRRRELVLLDERPVHIHRQRHRRRGAVRITQRHRSRAGVLGAEGEGGVGGARVAVGVARDEAGAGVAGVIGGEHRATGERCLLGRVDGGGGRGRGSRPCGHGQQHRHQGEQAGECGHRAMPANAFVGHDAPGGGGRNVANSPAR